MTKSETIKLIMRIKAMFPYAFTTDTEEMLSLRINDWYECLKGYSHDQVMDGFKLSLMKKDNPPTISDLVGFIQKAERLQQPSDNELWNMLLSAVKCIKTIAVQEYQGSCYRTPLYQLKDKSRCMQFYEQLPFPVKKTIDFDTFILFAGLDDKSLSIERNRFLKAIPDVRTAISERQMLDRHIDTNETKQLKINNNLIEVKE